MGSEKYPVVVKPWQDKRERLAGYFQFTTDIRRMAYTANAVGGYHRQVRKETRNKGVFTNEPPLENRFVSLAATYVGNGLCP